MTADNLAHLKPWLEDAARSQDRLRREIGAAGAGPHGHRGAGLRARRDAIRLPAGCRPLRLPAGRAGAPASGSEAGRLAEQHADIALEIWQHLAPAVEQRGVKELYSTIELPLARVLARMERTGVRIDCGELKRLSVLMEGEIARLTAGIHGLAGKASTSPRRSSSGGCCSRIWSFRRR